MSVIALRTRTLPALVLIAGALSAVGCASAGFGDAPEFEAIPVDEARLVLYAPGLEPVPARYSRRIDGLKSFELGRWQPASGSWPDASLVLLAFTDAAPSGMTWVSEPSLEARIREWFPSETIDMGGHQRASRPIGEVEYQRFTRSEVIPCVFVRIYADTFSDQRSYRSDGSLSHGNFMVRGWYCAPPNTRLEHHTVEHFVAGIGVKGMWLPQRTSRQAVEFAPAAAAAVPADDDEATVQRVVFTTRISPKNAPVDDIREISMKEHDAVYIFVQWKISLRHHAEFFNEWRVYDGGGYQKLATGKLFEPRSEDWRTWLPVQFAKSHDKPGEWRFEVYFDNEKMVEEYLTVLP